MKLNLFIYVSLGAGILVIAMFGRASNREVQALQEEQKQSWTKRIAPLPQGFDGEAVWLIRVGDPVIQIGAKSDGTIVWRKLP